MDSLLKRAQRANLNASAVFEIVKAANKAAEAYAGSGVNHVTPESIAEVFTAIATAQIEFFEEKK